MILRTDFGIVDVLLATDVLRALERIHAKRYVVEMRCLELFCNNPHVRVMWKEDVRNKLIKPTLDHPLLCRVGSRLND